MVREIPNSNDWRTDTDNPMVNAFRELMMENNQYQDDPYVGIFWYDVDEDDLFGVVKTPAKDSPFYKSNLFSASAKTCSALHYKVWQKGFYRGKDKRFQGDYTKVPRGRIFEVDGKMNQSVLDTKGEVLLVSNFTLCTKETSGARPDFGMSADKDLAKSLYLKLADELDSLGVPVKLGVFGADMQIQTQLDGPVTIIKEIK